MVSVSSVALLVEERPIEIFRGTLWRRLLNNPVTSSSTNLVLMEPMQAVLAQSAANGFPYF